MVVVIAELVVVGGNGVGACDGKGGSMMLEVGGGSVVLRMCGCCQ